MRKQTVFPTCICSSSLRMLFCPPTAPIEFQRPASSKLLSPPMSEFYANSHSYLEFNFRHTDFSQARAAATAKHLSPRRSH